MRSLVATVLLFVAVPAFAKNGILVAHVKDIHDRPIGGVRLRAGAGSSISPPTQDLPEKASKDAFETDTYGQALVQLAPGTKVNDSVILEIVGSKRDLVFISPWDKWALVPPFDDKPTSFVPVVLADRNDRALLENSEAIKAIASQINQSASAKQPSLVKDGGQPPDPLVEVAKRFGLKPGDVDQAIRAWGKRTRDPYERALAELYTKQYPAAEQDFAASLRQAEEEESQVRSKVANRASFLGQTYFKQGKYALAIDAFKKAAERRPEDSDILFRLAHALAKNGQSSQAWEIGEQALKQSEERLGLDNVELVDSYFDMGSLYVNNREYSRGEVYFAKAVDLVDRSAAPKDHTFLHLLSNLAMLYMVEGKEDDAERTLKHALELQVNILDPKDPEVAYAQNALAAVNLIRGKYADAEILLDKSWSLLRDLPPTSSDGKESPWAYLLLDTMKYLITVYEETDRYNKICEEFLQKALRLTELTEGKGSIAVRDRMRALARFYMAQSRFEDAARIYNGALKAAVAALGENTPEALQLRDKLIAVYLALRRMPEAEAMAIGSLKISAVMNGVGSPATNNDLYTVADVYESENKYEDAERSLKQAVANVASLKEISPVKWSATDYLAAFYISRSQFGQAEDVLNAYETLIGNENDATRPLLVALSARRETLYLRGLRYDDAERELLKGLGIAQRLKEDSPAVQRSQLVRLMRLDLLRQRFDSAEEYGRRALALPDEPTGQSQRRPVLVVLASVYEADKKYPEAEAALTEAVAICQNDRDTSRMVTALMVHKLASFYLRRERKEDAERLSKHALEVAEAACWEGDPDLAPFLSLRQEILRTTNRDAEAAQIAVKLKKLRVSSGSKG